MRALEDALRTLVMNPSQPDFWTVRIVPTEQPYSRPRRWTLRRQSAMRSTGAPTRAVPPPMEQTDISIKYARNQKLPSVDLTTNYNVIGLVARSTGSTTTRACSRSDSRPVAAELQPGAARRVRNDFRTWSVQLNVSYPLGTSVADAALAQSRLQREQQVTNLRAQELQVTAQVRDAGRQVDTSLKRVEATRKAREFAERRYEAEQKR